MPTSEAYFTDAIGPADSEAYFPGQPAEQDDGLGHDASQPFQSGSNLGPASKGCASQQGPGSTHSRGSGTVDSPIPLDDDLGRTRRLLFPSPRKDGTPKVLGQMAVNVVRTAPGFEEDGKGYAADQENMVAAVGTTAEEDEMEDLFGTPPARPSTPPPRANASSGPFKTPTRPTPNHRPITRSVSKSIRSTRSMPRSPSQTILQLQRTPSKTPRSSGGKRRTPGRHAHFGLQPAPLFDSPFTATVHQLLSEANEFTAGSPSHGLGDLDLSSLPNLDSDGLHAIAGSIDFGNYLSTDLPMSSSSPLILRGTSRVSFNNPLDYDENAQLWSQLSEAMKATDD